MVYFGCGGIKGGGKGVLGGQMAGGNGFCSCGLLGGG